MALYAAALILLATSSLPLFTMTFVPAFALLFLLFYTKNAKEMNWPLLITMGVVATIILAIQFWVSYTSPGSDRILIAPFKSMLHWTGKYWLIVLKILMSIVFPLYVTIYYWKDTKKDLAYRLGWINFVVALLLAILLAEQEKYTHGNFFWGPMLAVFILFVVTTIHYIADLASRFRPGSPPGKTGFPRSSSPCTLFAGSSTLCSR